MHLCAGEEETAAREREVLTEGTLKNNNNKKAIKRKKGEGKRRRQRGQRGLEKEKERACSETVTGSQACTVSGKHIF